MEQCAVAENIHANVALPPDPFRVPSQRDLLRLPCQSANDKENEMIPGLYIDLLASDLQLNKLFGRSLYFRALCTVGVSISIIP